MSFLQANAVGKPKVVTESTPKRPPVTLSMYTELPEGEVSLEEFERFAMDRLRGEAGGRAGGRAGVGR